ncbi:B-cell receptor CD22-like [Misgurnus anguillicaudatus]|uniref:B-cell receptor CD22-like n=1 Tax=Misgurnus anguillicaudatus TaxID=75329 RepID=UPI003CCFC082
METAQKIIPFIFLLQGAWCADFNISMPGQIDALSGSCFIINCRYEVQDTYNSYLDSTTSGLWYKTLNGVQTTAYYSLYPNQNLQGNITGILMNKDCTTIFYNVNSTYKGTYFFRVDGRLKYTFSQKNAVVNVMDSPSIPTVQMFQDQIEVQEVLEGSSMCLRCSAETLCSSSPPTLTWSSTDRLHLNGSSTLQLDQQNQTQITSDLNFTTTYLQHGVTFFCTITYQLQQRNATAQSNITLRVLYAPKNTSVSVFPSNSVLEGSSVTLICSSDGNPAVSNYTWYRQNGTQLQLLQTRYNITFNVTDRTQAGPYYCQAQNLYGTQNTSVLLDIQFSPKNTSISVMPSSTVLEGYPVTLNCSSEANPPNNYTWYRDIGGRLQLIQTGLNLSYSAINRTQSGRYYCVAQNKYGQQNSSVLLDIQYPPNGTSISVSPSSTILEGNPVSMNCSSNGYPAVVNYTWYRANGGQLQLLQTGNNLTINVTTAAQRGWYYCVAQNKYGQQNTSILLDVLFSPKNTSISGIPSSTVLEGYPVTLNCSSEANPPNNYTLYRDIGGRLQMIQTGYNFFYNVTYRAQSGRYYCVAQNKYGQQNSSVLLDIQCEYKDSKVHLIEQPRKMFDDFNRNSQY